MGTASNGKVNLSRRNGGVALAVAVTAASLAVAGCGGSSSSSNASTGDGGPGDATEITFAGLFDLSGPLATFGKNSEKGLQLAGMQINGEGGFTVAGKKYKIKVDVADGRTDPTASVAAVRNFLQAGDKFLFGPDTDATSLQVLGVTKDTDTVQFLGGAVDQKLIGHTGHERAFGVVTPNELWQGSVIPALKSLKITSGTVAVAYPNDTAGQGAGPEFVKLLQENGFDAKLFLFPPETTDFRSVVARIKAASPVAILDGYSPQWGLPIAQAAAQLHAAEAIVGVVQDVADVPLVVAKSTHHPFPLKWATVAADQQASHPTTPGMNKLKDAWVKYFHRQPTADESRIAVWFYDAALNVVQGMKQAGTVSDTKAIADAIRKNPFEGAETIHYTPTNNPVHGTDYVTLVDGKTKYVYVPPPGQ